MVVGRSIRGKGEIMMDCGPGGGGEEDDEKGEEKARTHFGIFATRALKHGEEIVVGWEWDYANAVHRVAKVAGLDGVRVFAFLSIRLGRLHSSFIFLDFVLIVLYLLYLHLRLPIILQILHLTCALPSFSFLPQPSFHSPWLISGPHRPPLPPMPTQWHLITHLANIMNDSASDIVSCVAALHPREKHNHPGNRMFQVASHPRRLPPPREARPPRPPPPVLRLRRPRPRPAGRPSSSRAPWPAPRSPTSRETPSPPPPLSSPPSPPSSSATASAPRDPTCKPASPALAPSHLPASLPRDRLPPALRIPLCAPPPGAPAPPSYPTHALAIGLPVSKRYSPCTRSSSPHTAPSSRALPPASPPSSRSSSITLPVLPLALPSPQAFAILHAYMYTHRIDAALGALLPLPPATRRRRWRPRSPQPSTRHALSAHLLAAAGTSLSALMAHAGHVKELWQDMVALGVYDPALWAAVDLAWEVVLGAMNLGVQSTSPALLQSDPDLENGWHELFGVEMRPEMVGGSALSRVVRMATKDLRRMFKFFNEDGYNADIAFAMYPEVKDWKIFLRTEAPKPS
ncbi:hypothetical protein B0H14DRAFT_3874269 [Mycena olivaceomarginata]|nr:hypothetical protein B0H14DRAFT_3874269 [Mycena olivaceomarginata]